MRSCISPGPTRPSTRTRGCATNRSSSGPDPITSIRAPGNRSRASRSVAVPLSATRRPTKRPPLRAGSLMVRLAGPPAPDAVLDFRRLHRARGLLRVELRRIHLHVDLLALGALRALARPGQTIAGAALALARLVMLLAGIAPSQAAGGVQIA